MTAVAAAALLSMGMVSAYQAARARHQLTWALGVVVSALATANAYALAVLG